MFGLSLCTLVHSPHAFRRMHAAAHAVGLTGELKKGRKVITNRWQSAAAELCRALTLPTGILDEPVARTKSAAELP